jgi:hypothetical protein
VDTEATTSEQPTVRALAWQFGSAGIDAMARKGPKTWQPVRQPPRPAIPDDQDQRAIITACETFIRDVLKPKFLPEIRPTEWNYLIDIHGAWAAGRYRFMRRYRSGHADNPGWEFDRAFARLDRMAPDRFDIHWMRHNGRWWPLHSGVTLADALRILETDEVLRPI